MAPRHLDVARGGVCAHDGGAKARQRLRQEPAAAADVEDAQPGKTIEPGRIAAESFAGAVADEAQPQRVDPVQHAHLAAWVPELGGQRGELRDLRRIDAGACGQRLGHVDFLVGPLRTSAVATASTRQYVYAPFCAGAPPRPSACTPSAS